MIDLSKYPKAKKEFEDWFRPRYMDNKTTGEIRVTLYDFYKFPFEWQWGVYLEFFDSVNLNIQVEADLFEMNDLKPNVWKYQYYVDSITDEIWFNTRTEAQQEAVEKAFEIREIEI